MSSDFNVSHIPFRFFCSRLVSNDPCNNLIIESSSNNIELNSNNKNFIFNNNNNTIFNHGVNLQGLDLSNIRSISAKTLNINTLFLKNIQNSQNNIEDYGSIENGYIRATTIGYNPDPNVSNDISGRSNAYFTYINVSGGDSSFNNSLYIKSLLSVNGSTTISNDLIVNGKSYVTLYNAINNYIDNARQELVSAKIITNDLSALNISVSNELIVKNTSFINDLSISGELLNNVLKLPSVFTIDPSGHDNASGTLIVNGDLIVYGNRTIIMSSNVDISDIALSVATNLINKINLFGNSAGLDISNVASLKYNGTTWNFAGGQLSVENKNVCLDVSFIEFRNYVEASLNNLNNYFDLSFGQLKTHNDNSFNATYSRSQIDASFMSITQSIADISSLRSYFDNSFVKTTTFDASFRDLKTYLDVSYIAKGTSANPDIIDSSLIFISRKLDLSYVLNSTFEGSFNNLKSQIEISFGSIRLTSLDTSSISVETINTKHSSNQRFNNILWNQMGLDISNGPPLANNNRKIAVSNDGKVVALSSSSHSDISKGRIYVYELSNNQTSYNWNQLGLSSEILVGVSNDDQFGWDIALSSDGRVVAGSSIYSDASGINCGQVRLFELSNNTNRWLQKGSVINGPRPGSESGCSISLAGNGNSIAIGAWKDNTNGTNSGAVRVYDFSANVNDWRQKGQTIAGISGSFEGYATALSLDGQTLASASIVTGSTTSTGGTISMRGSYKIHSFTTVGTTAFTISSPMSIDYLVIAGGGGGGVGRGGGGGAGGVKTGTITLTAGSYGITVGAGGASRNDENLAGNNGWSSSIGTLIVTTGGGGGGAYNAPTGNNGGSGGGQNGGTGGTIGLGISGEGFSGAPQVNDNLGGGGGGAGGSGSGSTGGIGISSTLTGTTKYYAGGGGGGGNGTIAGVAYGGTYQLAQGTYGGGNGASTSGTKQPFQDALDNTGGGGGGQQGYFGPSGAGGSGIVIIRYLMTDISLVKTFTISGTTWNNKGVILGPDISFGKSMKLSANGNAIVIGAPGYRNYTLSTSSATLNTHIQIAQQVNNRTLATITNETEYQTVRALIGSTYAVWIGGRRTLTSTNPQGKSALDWEWINGDTWSIDKFGTGSPNNINSKGLRMFGSGQSGIWGDCDVGDSLLAVYMTTSSISNLGQAYVYRFQGGTTWTQLGQTIQGISGGDEFGSSVSMSNDGTMIAIGSDNNSSNRGHVRVFAYANNYWAQLSTSIGGKTVSSRAGIHALSGDGTTLIQSNNTYNSVYGINKTLAVNAPMTSISGNLIVIGAISVNSLDISTNHVYSSNGYSYKMFGTDISTTVMKEYYSDVTSSRHLKVQITGNGDIRNRNNSYRALSDSRLKENIVTSGPKLEDLLKVRVVDYKLKGSDPSKYIGVLAQELEGVFPNLVTELEPSLKDIEDGNTIKYKAVNYSSFDAILIKSLQEQNAMLKNIEKRIIALENL